MTSNLMLIYTILKFVIWIAVRLIFWILVFKLFSHSTYAQEATIELPITEDTYTESYYPLSSPWDNRNLYLGYEVFYEKGETIIFLKYDRSLLQTNGIKPEDIIQAKLILHRYQDQGSDFMSIAITKPISNWDQFTLNWNNMPEQSHILNEVTYTRTARLEINLTDQVKEDFINDNKNGFSLRNSSPLRYASIFWSSSCHVAPFPPICDANLRPVIQIQYKPNTPPTPPALTAPLPKEITNSEMISFEWQQSTDAENELITYTLQISKDPDFDEIIHQVITVELQKEIRIIADGNYFWRVIATDEHTVNNQSASEIREFIIDRTSPQPPGITYLPPIIFESEISVFLSVDETELHGLLHQAEYSTSPDFSSSTLLDLTETKLLIKNLRSTTYYLRARSLDNAGNISTWSTPRKLLVDLEPPVIADVKSSHRFISPLHSPGIQDYLTLDFSLADLTFSDWQVEIYESNGEMVEKFNGDSNRERIDIGSKYEKEGLYYITIAASDKAGRTLRARVIEFIVDNQRPKPSSFSRSSGTLTNKLEFKLTITPSESDLNCNINSNTVHSFTTAQTFTLPLPYEGDNLLTNVCTDPAGNSTENQIVVIRDTTPPPAPKLAATIAEQGLKLSILSEDSNTVDFFESNNYVRTISPPYPDQLISSDWITGYKYTFTGYAYDLAGNRSPLSEEAVLHGPIKVNNQIGGSPYPGYTYPKQPSRSTCTLIYNLTTKEKGKLNCDFVAPTINYTFHRKLRDETYWIAIFGSINREVALTVHYKKCKGGVLGKIFSSFICNETNGHTSTHSSRFLSSISAFVDKQQIPLYIYNERDANRFDLVATRLHDGSHKAASLKQSYNGEFKLEDGSRIGIKGSSGFSNEIPVAKYTSDHEKKYFGFPFDKTIGVTQWHGFTAFASPHTGIDFGAVRERVLALADGYVRQIFWDNYNGPCRSGGNVMQVEYDNGMFSMIMHMESFKKSDGSVWQVGQRVQRGQQLGISGNTGAANCSPLGHHLHLEVTQDRYQRTHLDPVKYIEYDWDSVLTLQSRQFPGRLTGDNPHPGQ